MRRGASGGACGAAAARVHALSASELAIESRRARRPPRPQPRRHAFARLCAACACSSDRIGERVGIRAGADAPASAPGAWPEQAASAALAKGAGTPGVRVRSRSQLRADAARERLVRDRAARRGRRAGGGGRTAAGRRRGRRGRARLREPGPARNRRTSLGGFQPSIRRSRRGRRRPWASRAAGRPGPCA